MFSRLVQDRNLRRLLMGRVVTNAGDSVFYIAVMWLVFELTGSELYTGIAGFLALAPQGLQFVAGPLVDRVSPRRILVATQVVQIAVVVTIPLAMMSGQLSVWLLLVVLFVLSVLNQPGYLAESVTIPRLVAKEDLVSTNSLFAVAHQGVFALFNVVGGVLIVTFGTVALFWADAVTFGLAAILFSTLRIPAARRTHPPTDGSIGRTVSLPDGGYTHAGTSIRDGVALVRGSIVAPLLFPPALAFLAIGGTLAVLPAYATAFGGAEAYGFLVASVGGGLLLGAVLASVVSNLQVGRVIIGGLAVSASAWTAALLVDGLAATAGLLLLAFGPLGALSVLLISMVQAAVPEELLGRVLGIVVSITAAAMPIGSLVGGIVGAATTPTTVLAAAVGLIAISGLYVLAVPSLRQLPRVTELPSLGVGGE